MKEELFVIIDGNSFIHRAYNALPPLTNKEGFPTNAITGTTNMIQSILKKLKPEKIVVAFDARGKNFRHEMYSDYKANRGPMDDDLRMQIEPIKEIIKAWGITTMCVVGVEADDSMSSLAREASEKGYKVVLATSDKDMRQMVSDKISILDTKDVDKATELMGPEEVFKKNGVYPGRIIDLLALMGDTADNIPGVKGCGEKTALKWINEYGDVEGIIDNADKIGGKIGEKLRSNIDMLRLSYKLVVIDKNVECGIDYENLEIKTNNDVMFELTSKYQLNRLQDELGLININAQSIDITIVSDEDQVISFINQNSIEKKCLYVDIIPERETSLMFMGSDCNTAYIIDMLDKNILINSIIDSKIVLISNNGKKVIKVLYQQSKSRKCFDITVKDTRVINYIKNGGQSKTVTISKMNENYDNLDLSKLRKKYKLDDKSPKWDKMTNEEVEIVKAEELVISKTVKIEGDLNLLDIEHKVLNILAYMELCGSMIDVNQLNNQNKEITNKIKEIETEIYNIAGEEFNINSPKQVSHILFDKLEIESKKKTTAEDVLIKLSVDNPIIKLILEYRSLSKINSTYIEGLLGRIVDGDRVHTTYHQDITTTGRLTSTDPNLQNIPIKTNEGKKIRQAFIAKNGYKILALDYSQIELRILAHFSLEKKLIKAFKENKDVHATTASELFNTYVDDVTNEQRRSAKTINFGLIYGMSARRLAEELGITLSLAKNYQKDYFEKYENIKPYFESELDSAKNNLYVETLLGRKIPTKDVNTNNAFIKNHAELAAKNAKIQGSASEIIKKAMVNLFDYMKDNNAFEYANMLMQVHDELVFEVREDVVEEFAMEMKKIMEEAVSLTVPLVVEYDIGDNWLEAH